MLKERILTALVLVPIVIWCIFFAQATSTAFMAFAGCDCVVGAWEWTALMRWTNLPLRALYLR
jgi:phosphatidate cytidylyltransferase